MPPMIAPAAAGAPILSASFFFVAGARREIVAVLIAVVPAPGVSSCVKRIAIRPRPFTLPGRCAAVTWPLTAVPAGSTSDAADRHRAAQAARDRLLDAADVGADRRFEIDRQHRARRQRHVAVRGRGSPLRSWPAAALARGACRRGAAVRHRLGRAASRTRCEAAAVRGLRLRAAR